MSLSLEKRAWHRRAGADPIEYAMQIRVPDHMEGFNKEYSDRICVVQGVTMMQMIKITNEKYKETKRLLRKAKQERQLVLFVGAGASVDAGMPLWKTAITRIAEKLNLDKNSNLDGLIVPQYYYNARGRKEYTQLMREPYICCRAI